MNGSTLLMGLVLATLRVAAADQESTPDRLRLSDPTPSMTEAQVREFDHLLDTAEPGDAFFVHWAFIAPLSLGELRQLGRELQIPRLLAMVEFRSLTVPGQMVNMPFVLGLYYDTADAWTHQVCRAAMYDAVAETSVAPAADWPVREIHVIAGTEAARALRSVTRRYSATLMRAHKQGRLNSDAMRAGATQELVEISTMCQPR
jgi:hypothetical protein